MARHAARELTYYRDDDGCLVIRARLPAEAGAVVLEALEAVMEAQRAEADEAVSEDVTAVTSAGENRHTQRRADVLATTAESFRITRNDSRARFAIRKDRSHRSYPRRPRSCRETPTRQYGIRR